MAMTLSERRPFRGMEAAARGDEGTPVVEELYLLTDRLYRAETPNDVYEAALDAITRALGCTRASVLLFDDTGIMRFAAWRGLSDAYRRAVEGHSPWPRDVKDPQPVCIHDVHTTDFPESLKATIKAEQIGALAFFPLVVNDALIGKFMTYYDARHVFSDAELALALTIARQLGFSLERRRAEEALRATQRQLVSELAATRQLQKISTQLIHASDAEVLYEADPRRRRGHHAFRLREHADVLPGAGRTSAPGLPGVQSDSGGVLGVGAARIGKHLRRRTGDRQSIDRAGHRIKRFHGGL